MGKSLIVWGKWVIVGIVCLEVLLRIVGFGPFSVVKKRTITTPENYLIPDDKLGFTLKNGTFNTNFENKIYSTKNHPKQGQRAVTKETSPPSNKNKIQLYGCSFTYGYHLSDYQTMAWKLQEQIPTKTIQNFGVPGYGLAQMVLRLQQELTSGNIPERVIINYASFHDERNILSRNWRKQTVPFFKNQQLAKEIKWPKSSKKKPFAITYQPLQYTEWPLMKQSSAIHFFETASNLIMAIFQDGRASSQLLFEEVQRWQKQYQFELLVTGMTNDKATKQMLEYCKTLDIATLDISVDLRDEQFSWWPLDMHPNENANSAYANKLKIYLNDNNFPK